jgi:ArsR family transcriptional regulator, arsenate/arsenite/antimonite-responsive transcriptional repressor / arsenate reductase (thioredoxin)
VTLIRHPDKLVRQLDAIAQASRLAALKLLVRYLPFGLQAGDIARLIGVPHNTLSTHLAALEHAGLVRSRREGRAMIYAAEPAACSALVSALSAELDPASKRGLRATAMPIIKEKIMSQKIYNVLVLCTGNSARSILAEALINREGKGRFKAFSAGSQPKGVPNPAGLKLLAELGYDTSEFRSKSWNEFAAHDAPQMDFIITVCDSAAGESCPVWPGHPLVAHWGIPDPADVGETDAARRAAFLEAYRRLSVRVTSFVNLSVETLGLADLRQELERIGQMEGATAMAIHGKAA